MIKLLSKGILKPCSAEIPNPGSLLELQEFHKLTPHPYSRLRGVAIGISQAYNFRKTLKEVEDHG